MTTNPEQNDAWQQVPQDLRDSAVRIVAKYGDLIPGRNPDAPTPSLETMKTVLAWQQLETDVLAAHADWLSRTRALFERRGWPWTTAELLARSHIREVGE